MWMIQTKEQEEAARKAQDEAFRQSLESSRTVGKVPGAWPTPRPIGVCLTQEQLIAIELVKSGDTPEAAADKARRILKALG